MTIKNTDIEKDILGCIHTTQNPFDHSELSSSDLTNLDIDRMLIKYSAEDIIRVLLREYKRLEQVLANTPGSNVGCEFQMQEKDRHWNCRAAIKRLKTNHKGIANGRI